MEKIVARRNNNNEVIEPEHLALIANVKQTTNKTTTRVNVKHCKLILILILILIIIIIMSQMRTMTFGKRRAAQNSQAIQTV